MSTQPDVWNLIQKGYYDKIDEYDVGRALDALHENIAWSHVQVWRRTEFGLGPSEFFTGRTEVGAFLESLTEKSWSHAFGTA